MSTRALIMLACVTAVGCGGGPAPPAPIEVKPEPTFPDPVPPDVLPPPEPGPKRAVKPPCDRAFDNDNSNQVFGRLSAISEKDDCEFEGVSTRSVYMLLKWKLPDESIIDFRLDPSQCGPDPYDLEVHGLRLSSTPAARKACPGKFKGVQDAMKKSALTTPQQTKDP